MAGETSKYAAEADSLFAFLRQTFLQMPRWVQVCGWFVFLFLFVFLVLYPLIGVTYVQGQVIKIDQGQDGSPSRPDYALLKVHHPRAGTVLTNEQGEFLMPIQGPVIPMTAIDFEFGENPNPDHFSLPAPVPFVSLFNPNFTKIYYTAKGTAHHYFLKEDDATKAYKGNTQLSKGGPDSGLGVTSQSGMLAPTVVQAAVVGTSVGFTMRIVRLSVKAVDVDPVYFVIKVNDQIVNVDAVPNAGSPASRMLSIQRDRPIQIDGFDIPLGTASSHVQLSLLAKRFIFHDDTVSSADLNIVPPLPQEVGNETTVQAGNLTVTYKVLPPMTLRCAGIESTSTKNLLRFVFWIEAPRQFLDKVSGVEYNLGPTFPSPIVSFPSVTKANDWTFEIAAYSPQTIRGKVLVGNGDSMTVSTNCDVVDNPRTAMEYYALARAYKRDGRLDLAIQDGDRALVLDRNLSGAIAVKADALAVQGNLKSAIDTYEQAVSHGNHDAYLLNGYAWLLTDRLPNPSLEQLRYARKLAEEAVASEPNPNNLDTLGWANYKLGDYPAAFKSLSNSVALFRENQLTTSASWQEMQYHLGLTLVKMDRKEDALQAFGQVLSFGKTYPTSNPDYVAKATDQVKQLRDATKLVPSGTK
jgi:Tfp pilus assembly protein PilF